MQKSGYPFRPDAKVIPEFDFCSKAESLDTKLSLDTWLSD